MSPFANSPASVPLCVAHQQPPLPQALLYLVPCTLGVVLVLALVRGELQLLLDVALDPQEDELEVDATDDAAGGGNGVDGSAGRGHAAGSDSSSNSNAAGACQQQKRSRSRAAGAGAAGVGLAGMTAADGIAEQRVALLAGQQGSRSSSGSGLNDVGSNQQQQV